MVKHSVRRQTQIRVQCREKRHKHRCMNIQHGMTRRGDIRKVPYKVFQLAIVLEPYHGRQGKTQEGPRWSSQTVRRKRSTLISVTVEGLIHSSTKPFSISQSVCKKSTVQ